jgi:hypothetical protein
MKNDTGISTCVSMWNKNSFLETKDNYVRSLQSNISLVILHVFRYWPGLVEELGSAEDISLSDEIESRSASGLITGLPESEITSITSTDS